MSSFEETVSVSGQELSSHRSLGFEELVEWMGPMGSFGDQDASVRYRMGREDFFFPLLDENDISFGMAYRRPKDDVAPVRKELKMKGCEEKENL